jgi:hypothetical protein
MHRVNLHYFVLFGFLLCSFYSLFPAYKRLRRKVFQQSAITDRNEGSSPILPPSSYPRFDVTAQLLKKEIKINFSKLKVDDPIFVDMPWPTEMGPEASAFARHMTWRRSLSDAESKIKSTVYY